MKMQVRTELSTKWGKTHLSAYSRDPQDKMPALLLEFPTSRESVTIPLVRIHSECLTGDLLGSRRCDCGEQLSASLKKLNEEGGYLIYLRQEGRGIGLINKLKAYNLQDEGLNTVEANHQLGLSSDARTYEDAVAILKDLKIEEIRLLTNNPEKILGLENLGIKVIERVSIEMVPHEENQEYLQAKKDLMGHLLK